MVCFLFYLSYHQTGVMYHDVVYLVVASVNERFISKCDVVALAFSACVELEAAGDGMKSKITQSRVKQSNTNRFVHVLCASSWRKLTCVVEAVVYMFTYGMIDIPSSHN